MLGDDAEGTHHDVMSRWLALLRPRGPVDLLLQAIGESVMIVDAQLRIVYSNDRGAQLCGYATREELMAAKPEDIAARFEMFDERGAAFSYEEIPTIVAFRTGRPVERTIGYRNRETGFRGVSRAVARPVIDEDGRALLVMSIVQDVTAEREREDQARFLAEVGTLLASSLHTEESLSALASKAVSRLADGCLVHLRDDGEAHPRCRIATPLAQAAAADPAIERQVARALETGRPVRERDDVLTVPLTARGKPLGTLTLVNTDGRSFSDADAALAEEVARRTALFLESARMFERAQRAVQVRDDFLAVASHDLQSPLGAILLSASVLAREGNDERMRQYARSILRAAERMDRLIHDLLDLAAIDAGRLSIDRQTYDASVLVLDALELLEPIAEERSIQVRRELSTAMVLCDRGRVLQILSNLVDNAIKFTPAGGAILVRAQTRGREMVFAVIDDGPGIDPVVLPHVFDRFWQGRKDRRKGVGLGLSIVRGLVEAQGGTVWVESEPGKGSAFLFSLPLA